jgi:chromosome segregation ATPase
MKIDNIKEEVTHDMENLRKENETETKNTMEGHCSRLEQLEDRISELEDKMEIKGKTEELLVKQLKTCKRNMHELTNSIKRPNLRIMGIEEEEQVICNIFNKIIGNFPNLQKIMLKKENLKARRAWSEVFWALNENNFKPRIL